MAHEDVRPTFSHVLNVAPVPLETSKNPAKPVTAIISISHSGWAFYDLNLKRERERMSR